MLYETFRKDLSDVHFENIIPIEQELEEPPFLAIARYKEQIKTVIVVDKDHFTETYTTLIEDGRGNKSLSIIKNNQIKKYIERDIDGEPKKIDFFRYIEKNPVIFDLIEELQLKKSNIHDILEYMKLSFVKKEREDYFSHNFYANAMEEPDGCPELEALLTNKKTPYSKTYLKYARPSPISIIPEDLSIDKKSCLKPLQPITYFKEEPLNFTSYKSRAEVIVEANAKLLANRNSGGGASANAK